jgi:hypothetical protein
MRDPNRLTQVEAAEELRTTISVVRRLQRELGPDGKPLLPKPIHREDLVRVTPEDVYREPRISAMSLDDISRELGISKQKIQELQRNHVLPNPLGRRTVNAIKVRGVDAYANRTYQFVGMRRVRAAAIRVQGERHTTVTEGKHELLGARVVLPSDPRVGEVTHTGVVFANIGHLLYVVREDQDQVVKLRDDRVVDVLGRGQELTTAWERARKVVGGFTANVRTIEALSIIDMHAVTQGE